MLFREFVMCSRVMSVAGGGNPRTGLNVKFVDCCSRRGVVQHLGVDDAWYKSPAP
jgi:hypothetical protein